MTWYSTIANAAAAVSNNVQGKVLWTRTTVNYTSGDPSYIYTAGYIGTDGAKGDKGDTGDIPSAGIKRSQQIFINYTTSTPSTPTSNGTAYWVTSTNASNGYWRTTRPDYNSSYPVTWTAYQTETYGGTVSTSTPYRDENMAAIMDGNYIRAGIINAARIDTGSLTASDYVSLTGDFVLNPKYSGYTSGYLGYNLVQSALGFGPVYGPALRSGTNKAGIAIGGGSSSSDSEQGYVYIWGNAGIRFNNEISVPSSYPNVIVYDASGATTATCIFPGSGGDQYVITNKNYSNYITTSGSITQTQFNSLLASATFPNNATNITSSNVSSYAIPALSSGVTNITSSNLGSNLTSTMIGNKLPSNVITTSNISSYAIPALASGVTNITSSNVSSYAIPALASDVTNITSSNVTTYITGHGTTGKLLWTNSSPTSAFTTTYITMSSVQYNYYDILLVELCSHTSYTGVTGMVQVSNVQDNVFYGFVPYYSTNSVVEAAIRKFTIGKNGTQLRLTVGGGAYWSGYSCVGSQNNYAIPLKIYGLRVRNAGGTLS